MTRFDCSSRGRWRRRDGFELTGSNAAAVAQICRRLEGVPLAIELAAAWIRSLSPRALLARLDHRLPLLVGGPRDAPARLQSVRNAVAWSYDALDGSEQRLLRHLAVFASGWTIEAADAVIGDGSALALLTSLVDKSLVGADESIDSEPRFGDARDGQGVRRRDAPRDGETLGARERHAVYFLEFVKHADAQLAGPSRPAGTPVLDIEHDNLRLALAWAQEAGDTTMSLQLAAALAWFWRVRSHLTEGRRWLGAALEPPSSDSPTVEVAAPDHPRARALNGAGFFAFAQIDFDTATNQFRGALALAREPTTGSSRAGRCMDWGGSLTPNGASMRPTSSWRRASASSNERPRREVLRTRSSSWVLYEGDERRRKPSGCSTESLAVLEPMGDTWGLCGVAWHWANVALATGDLHPATERYVKLSVSRSNSKAHG